MTITVQGYEVDEAQLRSTFSIARRKVEHGWVQHVGGDNGRVCLDTAIDRAAAEVNGVRKDSLYEAARRVLKSILGLYGSIIDYNDAVGRTQQEVVDACARGQHADYRHLPSPQWRRTWAY